MVTPWELCVHASLLQQPLPRLHVGVGLQLELQVRLLGGFVLKQARTALFTLGLFVLVGLTAAEATNSRGGSVEDPPDRLVPTWVS